MLRTLLLLVAFLVLSNCSTNGSHQPQPRPLLSSSTGVFSGTITPFRTPITFSRRPAQGSATLTEELIHRGSPGQVLRQLKAEAALELRENGSGNGYVFEISNVRAALYQDGKVGAGALDAKVLIDVDSAGRQRGEPQVVATSGTGVAEEIVFPFNDEPAFVAGTVQTGTLVFETHAPLLYTDTIPGGFRTHKKGVVSGKTLYQGSDAILIDVTGSLKGPNVNMSILGFAIADAQSGLVLVRETKAEGQVVHPQFGRVPLELRAREAFTW